MIEINTKFGVLYMEEIDQREEILNFVISIICRSKISLRRQSALIVKPLSDSWKKCKR